MSLNRLTAKTMLKNLTKYESYKESVGKAVGPNPTCVKSLPRNRDKFEESFLELRFSFDDYKRVQKIA